jgi:hypothetical protein
VIERLETKAAEAGQRHADPMWRQARHTPQLWAQRAYLGAIDVLRRESPKPGDDVAGYLDRVRAEVASYRGNGPDLDDESWYDGAIDDACSAITT